MVQVMAHDLLSNKPLPESMKSHFQWDPPWGTNPVKFDENTKNFLSRKCNWKGSLQHVSHFVWSSMCYHYVNLHLQSTDNRAWIHNSLAASSVQCLNYMLREMTLWATKVDDDACRTELDVNPLDEICYSDCSLQGECQESKLHVVLFDSAYLRIWRHEYGSTLAQVMACCLTAPSHYLNQCWLIINKSQWHSSEGNFARNTSAINH